MNNKTTSGFNMTMKQNTSADTLSGNQHNALYVLSKYRHNIHCAKEEIMAGSDRGVQLENFLRYSLPVMLHSANLPVLNVTGELEALDFCLGASSTRNRLKNTILSSLLEAINVKIEEYLREMDWQHGTSYAPSGVKRIRRREILGTEM